MQERAGAEICSSDSAMANGLYMFTITTTIIATIIHYHNILYLFRFLDEICHCTVHCLDDCEADNEDQATLVPKPQTAWGISDT